MSLSSSLIRNSNDEINFPHKLLLTDTQVSKIPKAFANDLSANTKFSKTQLSQMIQSGGILGDLIAAILQVTSNVSSRKISIKKGKSLAKKLAEKATVKE